VPGFLVNRFAQALFREAIYLIEQDVTTPADIDRAIKYALGMRYSSIGLLEYFDAVGFELESAIAENVYPDLCNTVELQKTVRDGLASKKTGQAAGQGLYNWSLIDQEDFRRRKHAPYFSRVKDWDLPGKA
jgi:3-hydroxybutyryl-CoA dehydrogenase